MRPIRHNCPECGEVLHEGEHHFDDGPYYVKYCKNCGYKAENHE